MPNAHGKPQSIILFISFLWSFKRRFSVKQIDFGVKILPTFATSFFCKSMEKRRTFFQQRSFKGEVQSRAILRERNTRELDDEVVDGERRRFRQKSFSVLFSCARNSAKSVALNYLVVRKISTLKMPTKVFFIFCIAFLHCQAKGKQKFVFFTCERDLNLWFIIFWHSAKIQNAIFQLAISFSVQQEKIGTI